MSGVELFEPKEIRELDEEGRRRLERLFYHCNTLLGGTSIPVHMERDDYVMAFESALNLYRTRSSRSVNQGIGFLETEPGRSQYVLHQRVDVVQRIGRARGLFAGTGSGGNFDSFSMATMNSLLRGNTGTGGTSGAIDLVSYEFAMQYQETIAKLFAAEIRFSYRPESGLLVLYQTPKANESIILEVSVLKTISDLLADHWAYDWLQKYTLAVSKGILGEKYSLFATFAGPQGGTVLKGEQLKQASEQEKERLEQELLDMGDSADIAHIVRG